MTTTYNHTLSSDILHKREDGAGGADGRDDWHSDAGIVMLALAGAAVFFIPMLGGFIKE